MTRRRASVLITGLALVVGAVGLQTPAVAAESSQWHVNFQSTSPTVPAGYVADSGAAFSIDRGYGWVEQSSSTPLSLTGAGRYRGVNPDLRLDSLVHMQLATPGRWEAAVPDGDYAVTLSVGDIYVDSTHRITVEGTRLIDDFVPTSSVRFASASTIVAVTDGRLTVDAAGGTNTKINYIDITPATGTDTTPPAAPTGLTAFGGQGRVELTWTAGTETDLAGYDVFRSTSQPVPTTGTPLNGTQLLAAPTFTDTTVTDGTSYWYVVRAEDTSGNTAVSAAVMATPGPTTSGRVRVNFSDQATVPPSGYVQDYGQGFGSRTGANQGTGLSYGWVAPGTTTARSLLGQGRNRGATAQPDLRLATLMHMQLSGAPVGAWEVSVPNGSYDVTLAVGDVYTDSRHRVTVEGTLAVDDFVPTSATKWQQQTVRVGVADGRLTLDPTGGINTKINFVDVAPADQSRRVTSVDPKDGATNVFTSSPVSLALSHPADFSTVTSSSVQLLRPDGSTVPSVYNSDGAGGVVVLTPSAALASGTTYRVRVTAALLDTTGVAFEPFLSSFTTGTDSTPPSPLSFTRSRVASLDSPTVLSLGPDGRLYVATVTGRILRYPVLASGALGTPQSLGPYSGTRSIAGLRFDPSSTATDLRLYVAHSFLGFEDAPNFTGKVSLLTGPDLATARDVITGLPRSARDHMNNGMDFGPDGRLYMTVGSLSGYGAPDTYWANRAETPLSAAILVADVKGDSRFAGTVDVNTATGYDPTSPTAPVRIHADGTRNAYDLTWHSNGSLYAPVNESAGGNAPAGPGGSPPALQSLPAGNDFLSRIVANGYYGHPNPSRSHYVLNGGNPSTASDPWEVAQYPVGQQPDSAWQRPLLDFGLHRSPNGVTEYRHGSFGGALNGKLLVTQFSGGDDLLAIPLSTATSTGTPQQIARDFFNPLDVIASPANGDIYVAEFGDQATGTGGAITLLRPNASDTTAPAVAISLQGTQAADGSFSGAAQVTVTATDAGSGIAAVTYTLDGGPSQSYTGPFSVTSAGSHTVVASARDVAGNTGSATRSFTVTTAPSSDAQLTASSAQDVLGLGPRMVFSTVNEDPRPAQVLTLTNRGTSSLTVTGLTITGPQAAKFRLAAGQPTSFTLAAGATAPVSVEFRPPAQAEVENYATLTISSNSSVQPTTTVALSGIDALDYEGGSEPKLAQIVRALGYTTNVGTEASFIGNTRIPRGDERISPFFSRADTSAPMRLVPVARYIARSLPCQCMKTGYSVRSPLSKTQLYYFEGGSDPSGGPGNQRLFPAYVGTTEFSPSGFLETYTQDGEWGNDGRNTGSLHLFRFYPAKGPGGVVIPNTWIAGYDTGTDVTDKNWDYQDGVFLLTNAKPEYDIGPKPTDAGLKLGFDAGVPGTVLDKDGQGTGFDGVQANSAGNQLQPGLIDLDTTASVLRLTSTAGTSTGTSNSQVNALQRGFDGTPGPWTATTRLVPPFDDLDAGFEQKALFVGPDQDNYLKVEVEHRNGRPALTVLFEARSTAPYQTTGATIVHGPVDLGLPSGLRTVDLRVSGSPATGTLTASYRVNSDTGAWTTATTVTPVNVLNWFSTMAKAGVLTSHQGSTSPIVGVYDSFRVDPA